jgi:hypothetical protein
MTASASGVCIIVCLINSFSVSTSFLHTELQNMDSAKNADHPTERDKNLLRKYGTAITRGNLLHHQLEVGKCIKALRAGQD